MVRVRYFEPFGVMSGVAGFVQAFESREAALAWVARHVEEPLYLAYCTLEAEDGEFVEAYNESTALGCGGYYVEEVGE